MFENHAVWWGKAVVSGKGGHSQPSTKCHSRQLWQEGLPHLSPCDQQTDQNSRFCSCNTPGCQPWGSQGSPGSNSRPQAGNHPEAGRLGWELQRERPSHCALRWMVGAGILEKAARKQ